jgi:hypothetical protein
VQAWLHVSGRGRVLASCGLGERLQHVLNKKRWIAEALRSGTISERERLAAFVIDEATAFAANPFPSTSAGAARQRWGLREIEFEAMGVASAGLPCLMTALGVLPGGEPLRQVILRGAAHVLYLLRHDEGGPIIGAVLHGKPGVALPPFTRPEPPAKLAPVARRAPAKRSSAKRAMPGQLDLFSTATA